jgi:hypothetical protein
MTIFSGENDYGLLGLPPKGVFRRRVQRRTWHRLVVEAEILTFISDKQNIFVFLQIETVTSFGDGIGAMCLSLCDFRRGKDGRIK